VEIKRQLDATEVFIADLIACSTCFGHHYAHHQELKSIIQWLLPAVFGALVFKLSALCKAVGYVSGLRDAGALVFKLSAWCGAEGYVSGLQDAAASRKPDKQPSDLHQTSNLKTKARNTTGSNHLYNTLELLMMGVMVPETC